MTERKIKKDLQKYLGKEKVFSEREYLLTYSYDATGIQHWPDIVVLPESDEDIRRILEVANKYKVPVTPRGAGVGLSGGSVPLEKGIVVCFSRMNKILEIDRDSFTAVVEPGVITYDLQTACEEMGLFYPPDPASLKTSTIGGNVAENAGGLRCFKYGVTGSYVLALEGFLVDGTKIKAGSPCIKDVAGYDIKSLLIGSEGTLAVISKIYLKLIPLPEARVLCRVDFASLAEGAQFINNMINSGIQPAVLEFMDKSSIVASYKYMGLPVEDAPEAIVLSEIDGNGLDVSARKEKFLAMVKEQKVKDFKVAETAEEKELLWSLRRNISPAISKIKPKKINEDIVVPTGKIPEAVEYIKGIGSRLNLEIVLFGHFGDGNIHTNVLVDPEDRDDMKRAEEALDSIFKYVVSVNGSITGEHGVGISKRPFLSYQFNEAEIALFKNIKKVFDPGNALNPGKIF
jgi:glycolate oxidase subunit GlcD